MLNFLMIAGIVGGVVALVAVLVLFILWLWVVFDEGDDD